MDQKQSARFHEAMMKLAITFNTELTDLRLEIYWEQLQHVPIDAVVAACQQALQCEKFFPVPRTLLDFAGYPPETRSPGEQAWERLRNRQTRYNREALTDPLTREVFEAMGGGYLLEWGFGNWKSEKEEEKRREFLARYREAQSARLLKAPPTRTVVPFPTRRDA